MRQWGITLNCGTYLARFNYHREMLSVKCNNDSKITSWVNCDGEGTEQMREESESGIKLRRNVI